MHSNIPGRPPIELPAYYEEFAWYYPNCELQTKAWFVAHAGPDWTYIDCGANVGYYTILFSQLSPRGQVHAIEPTKTADMLRTNVRHHACRNVTVHEIAMGRHPGRRVEKVFRLWGQPPEVMEYDFATVDSFVASQGLNRVDCLKIDVDSFDFEVLQGAEQTLKQFNPWILIELTDSLSLRNSSPGEVLTWLEARGYASAVLLDQENFLLKRDAPALDAIPLQVLRWALSQGCMHVLKREILQLHASPPWACADYAARAMEAAASDPVFVQLLQGIVSAEPKTAEVGQLLQYAAIVRSFAPDLILELGGWRGATTSALALGLLAASKKNARLLSWRTNASPDEITQGTSFPAELQLATFGRLPSSDELPAVLTPASRILIFSNDPSPEATKLLLGVLLPALHTREHLVILHGVSDGHSSIPPTFSERPGVFALGNVWSARADLPQLVDFAQRNELDLFSASRSLQVSSGLDQAARERMRTALGETFFSQAHWRWLSFNARHNGRFLFPPP